MQKRADNPLIAELRAIDRRGSFEALVAAFETHATDRDYSRDLIRRILALTRESRLPAGAQPYMHVNGFVKLLVASLPTTGVRLTLHYWPESIELDPLPARPHRHRFSFSSVILAGTQVVASMTELPNGGGQPWRCYEYWPYASGRLAYVVARGRRSLESERPQERVIDSAPYRTGPEEIHTVSVDREHPCATLVLRGPRVCRSSTVFYPPARRLGPLRLQLGQRHDHHRLERHLARLLDRW